MKRRRCAALTPALLVACWLLLPSAGLAAGPEAETADGKVQATLDAGSDRRIAKRLEATFSSLETLEGVEVEVRAGVVKLTGEVLSSDARQLAAALARQVEGVTAIENSIQETRSLERRVRGVWADLQERAWDALRLLPLLGIATLIFSLFVLLARLLGRSRRPYSWLASNVFVQDLYRQLLQGGVLALGLLLALEILDATALVGAVLGAAGLVGLAVGFAFRDLVENYIASILLGVRQPFAPQDHVCIEGKEGKVLRLTSRATVLLSFDGNHIRLPNATVFKATIENFSRKPERRFQFSVGVGTDVDLAEVQDLGLATLREIDGVLHDPPPVAVVDSLGDSTVVLNFFGWVDQRESDFGSVRSEAIRLIKRAFDEAGVAMPEPTLRVVQPVPEQAPARQAPRETAQTRDTRPDRHLEREIEAERAAEEPDLLSPNASEE